MYSDLSIFEFLFPHQVLLDDCAYLICGNIGGLVVDSTTFLLMSLHHDRSAYARQLMVLLACSVFFSLRIYIQKQDPCNRRLRKTEN